MNSLPMADAVSDFNYESKTKKLILNRQLVGAANNVKWNTLLTSVRSETSMPCFRTKVVNGYVSHWDNEWYYGLPFPMLSIEWLDIEFEAAELINGKFTDKMIDKKMWIIGIVEKAGFEYETNERFVRIFGYFPKCYEAFYDTDT
jgi:hypothetical protein